MKFFIIDAFSEVPFGGNTAGVVFVPKDAEYPTDEVMQKVAAGFHFSETAFIQQVSDQKFHTRFFTPTKEVNLCGHATIAAFKALYQSGIVSEQPIYTNITKAGELKIQILDGVVYMDMAAPQLVSTIEDANELEQLYRVMGLSYGDMVDHGVKLPVQIVSTGLPDIMLPISSIDALFSINPDYEALTELSKKYNVIGVHAFVFKGETVKAHVRNFAPLYGINEESATGTSNGALTYYGFINNIIHNCEHCTFSQGEIMKRPSIIYTFLNYRDKDFRIQVGGKATIVANGNIDI